MKFCYLKTLDNQHFSRALSAKGKQWAVGEIIDIAFVGGTPSEQSFVKRYAEEWLKYANVKFRWGASTSRSDVRISFMKNRGSWSYVGTDCMFINKNRPTMNFGWLDKATVLHEFGHMLGLKHEHQNPKKGIEWNTKEVINSLSGPPNNWDLKTIRHNVLDQADITKILATEFDPDSIMLYHFPDSWTKNMGATRKNTELSQKDKEHVQRLYPFPNKQTKKEKDEIVIKGGFSKLVGWFKSLFS